MKQFPMKKAKSKRIYLLPFVLETKVVRKYTLQKGKIRY